MVIKKLNARQQRKGIKSNAHLQRLKRQGPLGADCNKAILSVTTNGLYLYDYACLVQCYEAIISADKAEDYVSENILRFINYFPNAVVVHS